MEIAKQKTPSPQILKKQRLKIVFFGKFIFGKTKKLQAYKPDFVPQLLEASVIYLSLPTPLAD